MTSGPAGHTFVYTSPLRRRPAWVHLLPPLALVASIGVQLALRPNVGLHFLVIISPLIATLMCGPMVVALYALAAAIAGAGLFRLDAGVPGINVIGPNELLIIAGMGVVSVFIAIYRQRTEGWALRVSDVAEAVQFAVIRRLPTVVGGVECAVLYRSAQRDAIAGGDLYDVRSTDLGVRAIVGDVKGHGLGAVSTMAALIGTFREAALDCPTLAGVAERLDRRILVDNAEREDGGTTAEVFATVVLLQFRDGSLDTVCCGHPDPLLLRDGEVVAIGSPPGPPVGLSGLSDVRATVHTVALRPRDTVLAFTDGLIEARDASGAFYPLDERLRGMLAEGEPPLSDITNGLWTDLRAFAPDVTDDVAVLALRPETPPEA